MPSKRPSFQAMAADLGNLPPVDSPIKGFDAVTASRLQIQAWYDAVRTASDSPPPSLPNAVHHILPSKRDSLSSVFTANVSSPSPQTSSSKPVYLFTWDEVHSRAAYIPPLIIDPDDIAGDRWLAPKQDGYFYYDPSVEPLNTTITSRNISLYINDAALDDPNFFKQHAVRLFLEVLHVPGIMNRPLFKYIGDYYVHKTENYLPSQEWAKLRKDVQDTIVGRFLNDYDSRIDTYRRSECTYTKSEMHRIYARGHMLPFVLLLQAYNAEPASFDLVPSPPWSLARRATELGLPKSATTPSCELESVYPQQTEPLLRSRFSVSSQGSSANGLTLYIDPPSPRLHATEITYETSDKEETQVIHLPASHPCFCRPASGSSDLRSSSDDDDDDEEEEEEIETDEYEYEDFNNSAHPINAHTPLRRSAFFVLQVMQSSQRDIQLFCEHLQNTADPVTEQGLARLEVLQILEGCSGRVLGDVAPLFSPLVAFSGGEASDDEPEGEIDQPELAVDEISSQVTFMPWFEH